MRDALHTQDESRRPVDVLSPRERALALQPLFSGEDVDVRGLLELAMFGRERRYNRGDILLSGDEVEPPAFFITEGTVAVQYAEAGISRRLDPPSVVGTINRFARVPVRVTAHAESDGVALVVPFDRVTQAVVRYQSLTFAVARNAAAQVAAERRFMPADPWAPSNHDHDEANAKADSSRTRDYAAVDVLLSLRRSGLFQPISMDAVGSMVRFSTVKRVPAGERLWHEGERSDFMLFVLDGSVRASTSRDVPDVIVGAHRFVGLLSRLIRHAPLAYSLHAERDSTLLFVDAAGAQTVLEDHTTLLFDLIGSLSRIMLHLPVNQQEAIARLEQMQPRADRAENAENGRSRSLPARFFR